MSNTTKLSLFALTWPILLELLLQMLIGNIDQFMISQHSQTAVGAIGNVNQIFTLVLIIFNVLSLATTILVTQYLGAKDFKKVEEIYTVSIISNIGFSIILSAIVILFKGQIFNMINLPDELLAEATIYLSVVGVFLFLQAMHLTLAAIFRSNELMKQTMIVAITINVINVIGNFILLNAFQMGVLGVAISSVFSRAIGVIVMLILFSKHLHTKLSLKHLRPFPKDTFTKLITIGGVSGSEALSYGISQIIILTIINTMGAASVTTKVYVSMIVSFSFIYSSAISSAAQVIVGHYIGARKEDEAKQLILSILPKTCLVSALISITLFLLSTPIVSLFTDNPEVISLAKSVMFVDIFLELGRTSNLICIRALQASGDIQFPVIIGITTMFLLAVLFSYIFGLVLGWGLVGVWIAMMLDECIRGVIVFIRWKKDYWRGRAVV